MCMRRVIGDRMTGGLPLLLVLLYTSITPVLHVRAIRGTQYSALVRAGVQGLSSGKHARHELLQSTAAVSEKRLQLLRASSVDFDNAYKHENQVQRDQATSLQLMHNGECEGVLWGQKELASSLKGVKGILKNITTPSCFQSSFEILEGPNSKTWRSCASANPQDYLFFSWVRAVHEKEGRCTWLKPVKKIDKESLYNCLAEVDTTQEIAVSGIVGSHYGCTACAVGEWNDIPCDSWCEDGLQGQYRKVISEGNAEYCRQTEDPHCDKCLPLWDVRKCNTTVKCATGLNVETHYCPRPGESGQPTGTWKKCQQHCASSFAKSHGSLTDLTTYYEADCMRFSFRNDTTECILHPLHTCPPALSTHDHLWISGDVLSAKSDQSSIVWSNWLTWSSCDAVDSSVGWKKRIRRVKRWGYAGDNQFDSSAWIDVASCVNDATPLKADVAEVATAPHLMCWVYSDFEEWDSIECVPKCGTVRTKTRSRKVRQQPVPQENGEPLPECAATKLSNEAVVQKKSCPGVVDCASECVFSNWAAWSDCRCTAESGKVAQRLRARFLTLGDKDVCGPLEETEKCEDVSCDTGSSQRTLYAFGGGIVALTLLVATMAWYKMSQNRSEEEEHM